jgi:ribosomal protein L40E
MRLRRSAAPQKKRPIPHIVIFCRFRPRPASYNGVMPICTRCGEQNPDNVSVCNKCGIAFAHQIRARADVQRSKNVLVVRIATWIAVVVVLILVAPSGYHAAGAAYLGHHLKSMTDKANIDCNGPIKDDMSAYQKDQVTKCLAANPDLIKAQQDYDNFTKGGKP